MKYITGEKRNQITLLPGCIEEYVLAYNIRRAINIVGIKQLIAAM